MWSKLSPGSSVAVVAPAGPVPAEPFRLGLEILASRYRVVHGQRAPEPYAPLPYLAGDDASRAATLNLALNDPEVEAVFFARGGYGCARMVEALDGAALARRPIPLIGFSDITVLHAWAAGLGLPSVHGPVVTQLARLPGEHLEALFNLLELGAAPTLSGLTSLRAGHARGPLWGGNLTVISHLCGTPAMPDLTGRVLLLEEINEAPYRVDRMLTQLRQAGALDQVAALLVGDMLGGEDPRVEHEAVLRDRLGDLGVPVLTGLPVGHGERNVALPLGWMVEVDGDGGAVRFGPGTENRGMINGE